MLNRSVLVLAAALVTVTVLAACGRGSTAGQPSATPSSSSSSRPVVGLCVPPAPLGVSLGDSWTISGPLRATENYPGDIPPGAATLSTTFRIVAIEVQTFAGGAGENAVQYPVVRGKFRNVIRDTSGSVVEDDEGEVSGITVAVTNPSPVLTPDWECHGQAWKDGWPAGTETEVTEETLPSGMEMVVFSVTLPFDVPDRGIQATSESHYAYDRQTGRLVVRGTRTIGILRGGERFSMELEQRLVSP